MKDGKNGDGLQAEEIAMILTVQLGSYCVKESLTSMHAMKVSGNETTRLKGNVMVTWYGL